MKIYPDPTTDSEAFQAVLEAEFCPVLFNPDGSPNIPANVAGDCGNRADCITLSFIKDDPNSIAAGTTIELINAINPDGVRIDGIYTIECQAWVCIGEDRCISEEYCEAKGKIYAKCSEAPVAECYEPCDSKSYFNTDICACTCITLSTVNDMSRQEVIDFLENKKEECRSLGYDTYKTNVTFDLENQQLLANSCECGCFDGLHFDRTLGKCVSEDEDIGACCSMFRNTFAYENLFTNYDTDTRQFFENTGCLYPTTRSACYGRGTFYPGERCIDVLNNAECGCAVEMFAPPPGVKEYGVWCSQDQVCMKCQWYEQWDAENCVCSCSLDNSPPPVKCPSDPDVDFNPEDCVCCPRNKPKYSENCGCHTDCDASYSTDLSKSVLDDETCECKCEKAEQPCFIEGAPDTYEYAIRSYFECICECKNLEENINSCDNLGVRLSVTNPCGCDCLDPKLNPDTDTVDPNGVELARRLSKCPDGFINTYSCTCECDKVLEQNSTNCSVGSDGFVHCTDNPGVNYVFDDSCAVSCPIQALLEISNFSSPIGIVLADLPIMPETKDNFETILQEANMIVDDGVIKCQPPSNDNDNRVLRWSDADCKCVARCGSFESPVICTDYQGIEHVNCLPINCPDPMEILPCDDNGLTYCGCAPKNGFERVWDPIQGACVCRLLPIGASVETYNQYCSQGGITYNGVGIFDELNCECVCPEYMDADFCQNYMNSSHNHWEVKANGTFSPKSPISYLPAPCECVCLLIETDCASGQRVNKETCECEDIPFGTKWGCYSGECNSYTEPNELIDTYYDSKNECDNVCGERGACCYRLTPESKYRCEDGVTETMCATQFNTEAPFYYRFEQNVTCNQMDPPCPSPIDSEVFYRCEPDNGCVGYDEPENEQLRHPENMYSHTACYLTCFMTYSCDESNATCSEAGYFNMGNGSGIDFQIVAQRTDESGVIRYLKQSDCEQECLPTTTPTSTPSVTPTLTPEVTSTSITPTLTASSTLSATPSNTASVTPSNSLSATPSGTPPTTPSNTVSATPISTPSNTLSVTPSNSLSATPSTTPSNTVSITPTLSVTPTNTASLTPSNTTSATPTSTPSNTPSFTPTQTSSPSASITPSSSFVSPSPTPTNSSTPTPPVTPSVSCIDSQHQSSVKMVGWSSGDRTLTGNGLGAYQTYTYSDETVSWNGVDNRWEYSNIFLGLLAYSDSPPGAVFYEYPWQVSSWTAIVDGPYTATRISNCA